MAKASGLSNGGQTDMSLAAAQRGMRRFLISLLPDGEKVAGRPDEGACASLAFYILTRSAFGSYIGASEASAFTRVPAISIS